MKKIEIMNRPMTSSKWYNMMTSDMVKLSKGNKKLKPTNEVKFLIWNLPSIRSCPFATAQCKANCYSIKAESQYGLPCVESRERHFNASLRPDFAESMIKVVERYYKNACKNGKRELFVRIHESGDFYSQQYFDKWAKIAEHFIGTRIVFQAYTKSVKFVRADRPANLHVTYSIWADTSRADIALAESLGLQTYSAVPADGFNAVPEASKCLCEDCATCAKCYRDEQKSIIVKIH